MIGLCSVTFKKRTAKEVIALAKEAKLEVIEWASNAHVPETDIGYAKDIVRQMKEAGLSTSSYGTYYRLGSFKDFEPYIEVAKILGTSMLRVWAGEKGSKETDAKDRELIIEDAQRIGKLAAESGVTISLEYHAHTLTDTPESTIQLMKEINSPHVLLYWQPAETLTVEERLDSLDELGKWVTNVHVFHWEHYRNRFPLEDGFDEWKQYIDKIERISPYNQTYLLEFVPGEDEKRGLLESAETLRKLVE